MDFSKLITFNFMVPTPKRSAESRSGFVLSKPGLSFKLLLIVVGVSMLGVLVSALLVLSLQRQQLIDSAEKATTRLGNAVAASLEHAMLSHDEVMAAQITQAMVSKAEVERVRILDAQGIVWVSSMSVEVGDRFDQGAPACQLCHTVRPAPNNKTNILASSAGHEVLLNVNVIRNQPKCAGCHDPQDKVLGHLMIETPLTDLRNQLTAGFWRMTLSALATFGVLVGLMILALRRLVTRPVSELARSAAEIGGGNLEYQMQLASHDELGDLAASFDTMRQQLRASRAEMERRNQELLVLNEVALAASQLLDLQQILDLALDTVVNRLGMQAGAIYMLDEEAGRFTLHASRGISDAQCQEIERLRQQPGWDLSQRVAQTGEGIFVADMAVVDQFKGLWDNPRGRSYVNVPLKSKGAVVGTMGLVTHVGQPLTEHMVEVLTAVGHEIGIALDNALLLAETRRGEQEATTLYQLGTQVSTSLELGQVLDAVAEGARQVLAADIGVVGLLDEERQEVLVKATAGTRTEALNALSVPVRGGAPGSALASGRPIIVEEYQSDLPILHDRELIAAEGIISFLAVPLRRGGHLHGLVGVMTRQRRRFTQEDIRLLTRLSQQVVVAIENARLYQQVRHLTARTERDRLARELHDYLAQTLGYLNVKASVTDDLLSKGQIAQAQASLLEMRGIAREAYTDVREAIFSLRTMAAAGLGLLPTLREYLAEYRVHYGLNTSLAIDDESLAEFPADVGIQISRIIQEALTNVRKHAQASRAWIRFEQDGDRVCISVEDDGRGFDPAQLTGEGRQYFGLQIMRERAEGVRGNLELYSQPGQGTRVVLWVPRAIGGQ